MTWQARTAPLRAASRTSRSRMALHTHTTMNRSSLAAPVLALLRNSRKDYCGSFARISVGGGAPHRLEPAPREAAPPPFERPVAEMVEPRLRPQQYQHPDRRDDEVKFGARQLAVQAAAITVEQCAADQAGAEIVGNGHP